MRWERSRSRVGARSAGATPSGSRPGRCRAHSPERRPPPRRRRSRWSFPIALLIVASALHSLRGRTPAGGGPGTLAKSALFVVGAVTGIGSSMSGTGGPLVLIPILLRLHVPVLAAVGLSQVIQLPISVFATAGNLVRGTIDFTVAAAASVLLLIGVWFGARIAHRVSGLAMKRFVSAALLAVGVAMLARQALHAAGGAGA